MDKLATLLGENIRSIRKKKGISQEGLALMCNVDRSYMGRIERGKVNLTVLKLYDIATSLDISPAVLLPEIQILTPND